MYPGKLSHTDTFCLPKTIFIKRTKYYLFGLLDDCTRLCYVEVIDNIQSAAVTKAFFNAYKWFVVHGITIKETMIDIYCLYFFKESKQTHFFETMLKIFDIKHRYTPPYRPQSNGKICSPKANLFLA